MTNTDLVRISGLESGEVPGACDENFYSLDRRIVLLEREFSHMKEWCGEAKNSLKKIEETIIELKDCVKPRLAEHGARIGNLEATIETRTEGNNNGNGNGLPSRKTIILVIIAATIAGAGGDKAISLLLKLLGVD